MKVQSAKAKGRNLQKWTRERLIEELEIHEEDVESRSMGSSGEDLIMARAAREKFPYSIECKNQERVNVWESYKQALANCGKYGEKIMWSTITPIQEWIRENLSEKELKQFEKKFGL